jgi:hypothetical protein
MTPLKRYCAFVCALLVAAGCNDDFSPKIESGNRYYLFCIVQANILGGGTQVALIDRMYDVPGVNPSLNHEDPFVAGARLVLTARGKSYVMKYGVRLRADTSRYHTPVQYYQANSVPIVAGDLVSVKVTLPDSTVLSASTSTPVYRATESSPSFANGVTALVDRENEGSAWVLDWGNGDREEHLFFPSLRVSYSITDSIESRQYSVKVPFKYVESNGVFTPVYPTVQSTQRLVVDFDVLNRFLRGLGDTIAVKNQVHLQFFQFTLMECDLALSRYYSSVNGYMDQFSVRLDERTYTNVTGGDGVFGSAYSSSFRYPVNPSYAKYFGYQVE